MPQHIGDHAGRPYELTLLVSTVLVYLFIYTFFFFDQATGQTRGWIFTRDSSKDVKSHKDVPFWGYKT